MEDSFQGLDDIDEYLKRKGLNQDITIKELEHIIDKVTANTSLTKKQSTQIIKLFFEEIRSSIVKKEIVDLKGLGKLFMSCPNVTGNKERVFIKFNPVKKLIKRMNNERNKI